MVCRKQGTASQPGLCADAGSIIRRIGAREKCGELFEQDVAPTFLLFPWLPTPVALRRYYSGFTTFMKVKKLVEDRKSSGIKYGDTLDFMIEQGDSDMNMMRVRSTYKCFETGTDLNRW